MVGVGSAGLLFSVIVVGAGVWAGSAGAPGVEAGAVGVAPGAGAGGLEAEASFCLWVVSGWIV